MDRVKVLNALKALQHSLAHDPDYMDLSGCAPELKWLINEYQKLLEAVNNAADDVLNLIDDKEQLEKDLNKTKQSYAQTALKLKRFKKRMSQIRQITENKNPSIKDIRYLANGYEMREDK